MGYWGYNPFTNHLLTSWDIQVQKVVPPQSLTANAPEKLPKPNRKGSFFKPSFFRGFQGRDVKLRGCSGHFNRECRIITPKIAEDFRKFGFDEI